MDCLEAVEIERESASRSRDGILGTSTTMLSADKDNPVTRAEAPNPSKTDVKSILEDIFQSTVDTVARMRIMQERFVKEKLKMLPQYLQQRGNQNLDDQEKGVRNRIVERGVSTSRTTTK